MANFVLLKALSDSLNKGNGLTLEQLKEKTDEYIKIHNEILDEIWRLRIKSSRTTPNDERMKILDEIKELQKKLNACKSDEQIASLLNEIKNREVETRGHSDLESNSPYVLCKS
ncbi:hypothetical protein [Legionella sp. km772]|uniref:hypothetical protein n=1 Tax=Legionella sp. km772 TaxID=2498111 RepID=UPI000F8E2E3D|nr:hypothetical protein [Legionella sp. km772]RUR09117.1 hypothetical protein ELY15_09660 [Legionella sp. km772]